jgi:16S rRNA (adenine1518-N6/adenine1519-N6)-dimethyltransferase
MAPGSHVARKRFGQHFLADRRVIERIILAIDPRPGDHMVEIGPGLGALTGPLLERIDHLHVVELDRDLSAGLRRSYPPDRLTVHEGDALRFEFAALPSPLRVVGNLPYNISTPLLFHLAGTVSRCTDLHFMLQKEVVDRMVAMPSTPQYGRLSVTLQYRFRMERLFTVAPEAFRPPPKVHSAVARMVPHPVQELQAADESVFGQVIAKAFSMRRKTLRNTLSGFISAADLADIGIDAGLRAEALPVSAFVAIANRIIGR